MAHAIGVGNHDILFAVDADDANELFWFRSEGPFMWSRG